jgi:hypothetical protein
VQVSLSQHHLAIIDEPRSCAARRVIGAGLACVAMLIMPACYAYVPAKTTATPVATPVRVKLTNPGIVAMESALGQGVNELQGTVLRASTDSLVLNVEQTWTLARQTFTSSGSVIAIPRQHIEETTIRVFSKKRTVITALAAVGGSILAGVVVKTTGSNSGDGNPPVVQP